MLVAGEIGGSLCRYIFFLISGDLNMSSNIFERILKYNSYSLNLNLYFPLFHSPQFPYQSWFLISCYLRPHCQLCQLLKHCHDGAVYFSEVMKSRSQRQTIGDFAGMFSSSEHFCLGFELLLFIILCSLVKCFSSNWFCKNHSLLETIVNFFICVWDILLYTLENTWRVSGNNVSVWHFIH